MLIQCPQNLGVSQLEKRRGSNKAKKTRRNACSNLKIVKAIGRPHVGIIRTSNQMAQTHVHARHCSRSGYDQGTDKGRRWLVAATENLSFGLIIWKGGTATRRAILVTVDSLCSELREKSWAMKVLEVFVLIMSLHANSSPWPVAN